MENTIFFLMCDSGIKFLLFARFFLKGLEESTQNIQPHQHTNVT